MMKIARGLWCALLATGCHDLPEVPAGQCGNLVVDEGEDCDGFPGPEGRGVCGDADEANACFFVCDPQLPDVDDPEPPDMDQCPPGWGCGNDNRCAKPSSTFSVAEGSPWAMPVEQFAIGDVDGDRHADLVGNNQQQLMVRFGNPEGTFPDTYQLNIRRPVGPVTYDFFDSDNRLDVVLPIEEGLSVLLGDEERFFEPVAYAPIEIDEEVKFAGVDVPETPLSELMLVSYTDRDIQFLFSAAAPVPLPAAAVDGVPRRPLHPIPAADVLDAVALDGPHARLEFVIAYPGDTQLRVFQVTGEPGVGGAPDQFAPGDPTIVALPADEVIGGGALFADVDGNGEQDLMLELASGQIAVYHTVGREIQAPVIKGGGGVDEPTFSRGFPLAAGDLDGDGVADYVYQYGVFITRPGDESFALGAFPVQGFWADAALGDFNGDGRLDVAVIATNGDDAAPLTGIDILINSPSGLFNRFHLSTERPARVDRRTLAVGDFDGDVIVDIAFVQVGDAEGGDELLVAFGARDAGFLEPVEMGELDAIEQVQPALAATGPESFDGISDLMVVSRSDAGARSIAVMIGDSSRRMIAPYLLTEDEEKTGSEGPGSLHRPLRALVGDFDGDDIRDLLVIAVRFPQTDGTDPGAEGGKGGGAAITPTAWVLPGAPEADGGIDTARSAFTPLGSEASFNFFCSTWDAVNLRPSGAEAAGNMLLGVDSSSACGGGVNMDPNLLMVQLDSDSDGNPAFDPEPAPIEGDLYAPHQVHSFDLGADSDVDPVVIFRGMAADPGTWEENEVVAGAGIGILWNDAGDIDPTYGVIPAPDSSVLNAVAAIRIDEDDHRDMVILTDDGLYRSLYDADAGSFRAAEPIVVERSGEPEAVRGGHQLGTGDMNGDGLEDIAIVYDASVLVLLARPSRTVAAGGQDDGHAGEGER